MEQQFEKCRLIYNNQPFANSENGRGNEKFRVNIYENFHVLFCLSYGIRLKTYYFYTKEVTYGKYLYD